jgi:uncharacterized repeat protein (TIGR02543 family)
VLKVYYTMNSYTVTFVDWNRTILAQRIVSYGDAALAPANPVRTGHTFAGWDRPYSYITSNLTVTAQYYPHTFTITFVDYNDTVLKSVTVTYGASETPPMSPTRSGYTFTGWDQPASTWTHVTADAIIMAVYEKNAPQVPPTAPVIEEEPTRTPMLNILGISVPLFGGSNWSLFNLICTLLAALLMILCAVRYVRTRKKDDVSYENSGKDWQDGESGKDWQDGETRKRRPIAFIVSALMTLAAICLFILTQDMSQPMAILDSWSIFFAIIVIIALLAAILVVYFETAKATDEDTQATTAALLRKEAVAKATLAGAVSGGAKGNATEETMGETTAETAGGEAEKTA